MFVEFIGLPASGKTTIAKGVYDVLKKNKNVVYPLYELYQKPWWYRNIYKVFMSTKFICSNLKKSTHVFFNIISSKQKRKRDVIRLTLNFIFFLSIMKKYSGDKRFIFVDEGFLHQIWAVSAKSKHENYYKEFKGFDLTSDIVVKVTCPSTIVVSRMKNRVKLNNRHASFIEDIDYLNVLMDKSIEYYENPDTLLKVLKINNIEKDDIESNVRFLSDYINNKQVESV